MWVTDFRLPTTNNLSERSLRFTKVHEKVSGQFESIKYAKYFALIGHTRKHVPEMGSMNSRHSYG